MACVKTNISKIADTSRLESRLEKIFEDELMSKESIFYYYNPDVIKKIVSFLSREVARPVSVGICGETASGKSTIVQDSIDVINDMTKGVINKKLITRINTDDYYYDRSKEVEAAGSFAAFAKNYDLDSPKAIELSLMKEHITALLNHKSVYLPQYDMSGTAKRNDKAYLASFAPLIIAEGLFALNEEVADVFDFKIYVDIEKEVQKKRFYERAMQRNLGDSADEIFKNASDKAETYVKPCIESADIVLNGKSSRERYREFAQKLMKLALTVRFEMFLLNHSSN
jgi:uridine kinase